MSFRSIIVADKLAAFYDPLGPTLQLCAEGSVRELTYGFDFVRDPAWVGGYKFTLYGWTEPLGNRHREYKHNQKFDMTLEPIPKDIVIVTANHQDGIPVPLRVGGLGPSPDGEKTNGEAKPTESNDSGVSSNGGKAIPTLASPSQEKINVLYKEPFSIKHTATVPAMGSIKMHYDATRLTIVNAGIQDNQIVWTFNSLQTGRTQVILTISGGIAQYIMHIVYDVFIYVLDSVSDPSPPSAEGDVEAIRRPPFGPGPVVLSFLGRVNIGARIVREKNPGAELYLATAYTSNPQGAGLPNELGKMTLLFKTDKGYVGIRSTGYDAFGPPYPAPSVLGSAVIDHLPKMDAGEADEILRAEGHKGKYHSLTLRKPLYPGVEAPLYEFAMVGGGPYVVDTGLAKVVTEQ